MKTERPLYINNSLSTGICNFNCSLCGVNKNTYTGEYMFQSNEVTSSFVNKVLSAASEGVKFRLIANAGNGEPTLHPNFSDRMDIMGDMIKNWPIPEETPELSVVTNGSRLLDEYIINTLIRNPITLNISIPTSNKDEYIKSMFSGDYSKAWIFDEVVNGIIKAMELYSDGKIDDLCFHISPPIPNMTKDTLAETFGFLCKIASEFNIEKLNMIMFPNVSNRTGLVENKGNKLNLFEEFFKEFNNKKMYNTKIVMENVWHRFFHYKHEIEEITTIFKNPCLWNANIFITAGGDSVCCNDQGGKYKLGNIKDKSITELLHKKEVLEYDELCSNCNQYCNSTHSSNGIIDRYKLNFND